MNLKKSILLLFFTCNACLLSNPHSSRTKVSKLACYRYAFDENELIFKDANGAPVRCTLVDNLFVRAQSRQAQNPCDYSLRGFGFEPKTIILKNIQTQRLESFNLCFKKTISPSGFVEPAPYCLTPYGEGSSYIFQSSCSKIKT